MSGLNIAIVLGLCLAGVGLVLLWAQRRIETIAKQTTLPADLEKARTTIQRLQARDLPDDLRQMALAIGSNMNVKQIAYKQLLTKRNNVTVKLAAARLVRLLREKGEQDSEIYAACESLVELGCVDPNDTEGLRRAGDRFAIEAAADIVSDTPQLTDNAKP